MKIGIIGAGFTGLAAGHHLAKSNHNVMILEKSENPGGLASGFKIPLWDWSLEKHYHHFFTNDFSALKLANELSYKIITKRPKTSIYVDQKILQLDDPIKALLFPKLSLTQRIRMGAVLGYLKFNPFWKPLETIKANEFLSKTMGEKAYKLIWEPQLRGKFGEYTNDIALSWFWARIKKRTTKLSYPSGGFLNFAEKITREIEKNKGEILFNKEVCELKSYKNKTFIKIKRKINKFETLEFDKVIVTLPSSIFLQITNNLPQNYIDKLSSLESIGAISIIIRMKSQFLKDGTYWLSICDEKKPFLAIVEHTNYMDKKYYNNENIVYVGKYLPRNHNFFNLDKEELLKIYDPHLKEINRDYKKTIIDYYVFKDPFAQPIIPLNYSKIIPPFETPLPNIYLANIAQVYPWDRGTNYAIELGEKIAELVVK